MATKYSSITTAPLLLEAHYLKMSKEDGGFVSYFQESLEFKEEPSLELKSFGIRDAGKKFSEAGNVLRRFELCFGRQQVALLVKTFVRNCLRTFVRDGY